MEDSRVTRLPDHEHYAWFYALCDLRYKIHYYKCEIHFVSLILSSQNEISNVDHFLLSQTANS